jgi:hypothetical protein
MDNGRNAPTRGNQADTHTTADFENEAARIRIEFPVHHQDGDFNRRKCRWVNPFCLQAQHVIPCLPLRPRVDFLFFIRTSRAAERTSDRLF